MLILLDLLQLVGQLASLQITQQRSSFFQPQIYFFKQLKNNQNPRESHFQASVFPYRGYITPNLLQSLNNYILTLQCRFEHIILSILPSDKMLNKPTAQAYRKYYLDHPTSPNHHQNYLIPFDNQYSILNQSRNPYAALDKFAVDIQLKSQSKSQAYLKRLGKESLELELRDWQKKQAEKENQFRMVRSQVRELEGLAKLKDLEYQLDRLSQTKSNNNQSTFVPFPMFMPFMGNSFNNSCSCRCNCQCNSRCNCNRQQANPQPNRYKPVMTENCAIQTDPETLKPSKPPSKAPTIQTMPTQKSVTVPPSIKRMPAQKRKNLLRKFRIYAYAIYFCIYFKWFSFQFSVNRYNNFKDKYLMDSGKTLTDTYKKVYSELLKIDIPQLAREAASRVPEGKPTTEKFTEKFQLATLLKSESIDKYRKMGKLTILSRNYETLFQRCGEFILMLLEEVTQLIDGWDWGDVGYGMGVGSLNQSFVIDNVFLPHQIYLLTFHDGKGYARISESAEKILIMTKFIIKLLLFNVCFQLDNNKEWFEMHQEELKEQEDLDEMFILLEISSKILFIYSQNMYEAEIQDMEDHDPNYDELQHKFKIEPCNPLVYSHSIKKRRELFKKEDIKESNLLIYGIEKLDEVNTVINMPFFKQMDRKIKGKMNMTLDGLLEKVKKYNRDKYQEIWEETLNNEYIVLRGLKKIMKSSRYYPYASASVVASNSLKTLTKKTIEDNRSQSKFSSFNSKISLENRIQRAKK